MNTQRQPMSKKRARRLATTMTVLGLIVVGGYATATGTTTLPAPTIEFTSNTGGSDNEGNSADAATIESTSEAAHDSTTHAPAKQTTAYTRVTTVAADEAPALAALPAHPTLTAQGGPSATAVGWANGEAVWADSEAVLPLASITKLVTVLVALEAQPVEAGAAGPVHVWSESDAALQEEYLSRNGIVFPVNVGTEMTTRQMLQLALIPSANDFAAAYANSVFGNNNEFVAAVADWSERHGLDSLVITEPTGMSEDNVATAADVLRVSRLALANPTVAEIVAQPSADMPWGIGTVTSTNGLFEVLQGVVGLKTGSTDVAGYNLAAAQTEVSSGRGLVKLAVVLGRSSEQDRVDASAAALTKLETAAQPFDLVADGEEIGVATTIDGVSIPLRVQGAASTVLVPGEEATNTAFIDATQIVAGPAGQPVGSVTVEAPTGNVELPIVTADPIDDPGFWWRLTHPARVFS